MNSNGYQQMLPPPNRQPWNQPLQQHRHTSIRNSQGGGNSQMEMPPPQVSMLPPPPPSLNLPTPPKPLPDSSANNQQPQQNGFNTHISQQGSNSKIPMPPPRMLPPPPPSLNLPTPPKPLPHSATNNRQPQQHSSNTHISQLGGNSQIQMLPPPPPAPRQQYRQEHTQGDSEHHSSSSSFQECILPQQRQEFSKHARKNNSDNHISQGGRQISMPPPPPQQYPRQDSRQTYPVHHPSSSVSSSQDEYVVPRQYSNDNRIVPTHDRKRPPSYDQQHTAKRCRSGPEHPTQHITTKDEASQFSMQENASNDDRTDNATSTANEGHSGRPSDSVRVKQEEEPSERDRDASTSSTTADRSLAVTKRANIDTQMQPPPPRVVPAKQEANHTSSRPTNQREIHAPMQPPAPRASVKQEADPGSRTPSNQTESCRPKKPPPRTTLPANWKMESTDSKLPPPRKTQFEQQAVKVDDRNIFDTSSDDDSDDEEVKASVRPRRAKSIFDSSSDEDEVKVSVRAKKEEKCIFNTSSDESDEEVVPPARARKKNCIIDITSDSEEEDSSGRNTDQTISTKRENPRNKPATRGRQTEPPPARALGKQDASRSSRRKPLIRNKTGDSGRAANGDDGTNEKAETPAQSNAGTHIVFVIDFSGSMKTQDVKTRNGRITRWSAVFQCMDTFLEDQLQQGRRPPQDGDDGAIALDTVMVSVVIFNDDAETLLERVQLAGNGDKVRNALKRAEKERKPRGGTGFRAGLERAKLVAGKRHVVGQNVVVVFLSDGRPGDLAAKPPKPDTPLPTKSKKGFVRANYHIEEMQRQHGDNLSLHFVCIHDEGKQWLHYLAKQYDGNFHKPNLSMDDDAPRTRKNAARRDKNNALDSDTDGEILEMKVKSQDTLIREKYQRALAAGQVHSLTNSTMRATFQSISSSVTSMRGGGSSRLIERNVSIKQEAPMIQYAATRMLLDQQNGDKFAVAPGEKSAGRKVKISMHPFAQGGLRNVYRMKGGIIRRMVAKESRHDVHDKERLRFHVETSKCQAKASATAKSFKTTLKKAKKTSTALSSLALPTIDVLTAEVYRVKDPTYPRGFRYLAAERELKGTYEKWNSNNGYVNPSNTLECQVAQAFSHFSYERSNQTEMVVDIQGVLENRNVCSYTDPQLHSVSKVYGRADRGRRGFEDFFRTHKCNVICKELGLSNRSNYF